MQILKLYVGLRAVGNVFLFYIKKVVGAISKIKNCSLKLKLFSALGLISRSEAGGYF